MSAVELTELERNELWVVIASVRDAAPRTPEDAATDDIIDAILDSGWMHNVITARLADAEVAS